jgi:hypothetical protein
LLQLTVMAVVARPAMAAAIKKMFFIVFVVFDCL